ncbi:MAG: MFS transporter [bacterium]
MIRPHLHFHLGTFFPHHLTRAVKRLFESVGILGFAISAVTIFEPIYLYTLGYSLRSIVGYYLLVYVLYALLLPFGAACTARIGYTRGMLIGSLLFIPYYLALFGIEKYPWLFLLAPALFAMQKMFYWPAYHADFSRFSTNDEVGREIGEASLVVTIVSIIGPIVGGAIVAMCGFPILFLFVIVLITLSNLPLLHVQRKNEQESLRPRDLIRFLRKKEHRRMVTGYAGYGEELIYMVLWPIFLYTIVHGVFRVGAIMTAAAVLVSLLLLAIGRWVDHNRPQPIIYASSIAISMSSFLRIIAVSLPLFLFAESSYRISRAMLDLPLLTDLYRRAKNVGFLATATLFEMGLSMGKIVVALALIGILSLGPVSWETVFLLGAVTALLFTRLRQRETTT